MSGKHVSEHVNGRHGGAGGRHREENLAEPTNTGQIQRVGTYHSKIRQVVVATGTLALVTAGASPADSAKCEVSEPAPETMQLEVIPAVKADPDAVVEYPKVKVTTKPKEVTPPAPPVNEIMRKPVKKTELPPVPARKPVVPAQQKPAPKPAVPVTPVPSGSKNAAIAQAALAQLGRFQDCTALVSNSLKAVGINHHGWPISYVALGTRVAPSQALPGDLIYYVNGGMGLAHIAVYIGNGVAVHGGWQGNRTVTFSANVGSGPVFIRVR